MTPPQETPLEAELVPERPGWDHPWAIISLLFLVMGALGLPMLWWSRSFSTWAKIWLSLVVTLYTAALFALTWWAVSLAMAAIREASR